MSECDGGNTSTSNEENRGSLSPGSGQYWELLKSKMIFLLIKQYYLQKCINFIQYEISKKLQP